MDLYLLNYKNYYDRKAKVLDDSELQDYVLDILQNANFNPGDGIDTSHVVNTYMSCNYVAVCRPTAEGPEIMSRWYVTEAQKTRNGQYKLILKRDVIADNYEAVLNAPVYIEKATLQEDDPMIFNSEGMTFNRIKQSETPLTQTYSEDKGWIVGYTQIPDPSTLTNLVKNLKPNTNNIVVSSIANWEFSDYMTTSASGKPKKYWKKSVNLYLGGAIGENQCRITNGSETVTKSYQYTNTKVWPYAANKKSMPETGAYVKSTLARNYFATYKGLNGGVLDSTALAMLEGQIIKDATTSKYYKIHFKSNSKRNSEYGFIKPDAGTLYNTLVSKISEDFGSQPQSSGGTDRFVVYRMLWEDAYVYLEETVEITGDLCFMASELRDFFKETNKAEDADYMMFCLPCPLPGGATTVPPFISVGPERYTRESALAVAQMLVEELQPSESGGNLIDLQLLPYCPIRSSGDIAATLRVRNSIDSGMIVCSVYCFTKSSFDFNIETSVQVDNVKVSNECDVYRLVAPNYSSSFEFSPAKNGGVDFFHVNCTYKPFTPYINIHPNFGHLYGQDFDDSRGLILGGDYSLPLTNDTFRSYQIQNKNYSAIFDRQMQNVDVHNRWNMAESVVGAVGGTVAGAAAGAMVGGIPGAIIGGVASAAGGIADIAKTGVLQSEDKNFKKDMYAYNLGNVDSKPNSLVKTSAFDISYKMWPFLEYITCTDEERQALIDKLKYNGMTVCRIGKIKDYLTGEEQYIQGQLIRLDLNDDSHMATEIANALLRGIYIE